MSPVAEERIGKNAAPTKAQSAGMIGMDVHEQHGVDLLWLVSRYPGLALSPPMLDRSSPAPVSTRMSCEPALIKNPLLDSSIGSA
jgi:hypothetical protein